MPSAAAAPSVYLNPSFCVFQHGLPLQVPPPGIAAWRISRSESYTQSRKPAPATGSPKSVTAVAAPRTHFDVRASVAAFERSLSVSKLFRGTTGWRHELASIGCDGQSV